MHRVVFYSWQSDLPNRTNRSFIQQALENVTKAIRADGSIDVEPVVDRDTQGVAGSPDMLEAYDLPSGFRGTLYRSDFDFIKFVGHELYTTFVACLIREGRWELIASLLAQGIPVRYRRGEQGPANCGFDEMSEHLDSFGRLNQERRRLCVHADLLKDRHERDPLGTLMPFEEFIAADYFLFLRGELPPEQIQTFSAWRPWSTVFM